MFAYVAAMACIAMPLLLWFLMQRSDRRHHEARMRLLQKRIDVRRRSAQSDDVASSQTPGNYGSGSDRAGVSSGPSE